MESLRGQIERISMLVIGVIATAISLADIFGVLDGFPFIKEKIPVLVLLVLGILSAYLVFERRGSLDILEKHLQQVTTNVNAIDPKLDVVAQRIGDVVLHGAEFFHSADELLTRMAELTIGSEHVSTLNLSPHSSSSPALDRYFDQVHDYMRRTSSPLKSFRSLATLENPRCDVQADPNIRAWIQSLSGGPTRLADGAQSSEGLHDFVNNLCAALFF